jgi:hypothetical protein
MLSSHQTETRLIGLRQSLVSRLMRKLHLKTQLQARFILNVKHTTIFSISSAAKSAWLVGSLKPSKLYANPLSQ